MNTHFCVLFFCISLFLLFQECSFLRKKATLTILTLVYLGIPSANISLSAWEIKGAGVPLFSYWHWEALAAIWHILAHGAFDPPTPYGTTLYVVLLFLDADIVHYRASNCDPPILCSLTRYVSS